MRPLEPRVGMFRVIEDFQSFSPKDSIVMRTFSDCWILSQKEPFIAVLADITSPVIRTKVTATLGYGQTALFTILGSKIALPDTITGVTSVKTMLLFSLL